MNGIALHDLRGGGPIPPGLIARAMPDMQDIHERARPIIEAVKRDGDAALQRFAREYDGVTCGHMSIRATESEFDEADGMVPAEVRAAIRPAGAAEEARVLGGGARRQCGRYRAHPGF